jgi:hypothetical protein
MSIYIAELSYTCHAVRMLTTRGISTAEVNQLPHNAYMAVRRRRNAAVWKRYTLVGHTDGERPLTIVIEETCDPASWLVITGWKSSIRERTLTWR